MAGDRSSEGRRRHEEKAIGGTPWFPCARQLGEGRAFVCRPVSLILGVVWGPQRPTDFLFLLTFGDGDKIYQYWLSKSMYDLSSLISSPHPLSPSDPAKLGLVFLTQYAHPFWSRIRKMNKAIQGQRCKKRKRLPLGRWTELLNRKLCRSPETDGERQGPLILLGYLWLHDKPLQNLLAWNGSDLLFLEILCIVHYFLCRFSGALSSSRRRDRTRRSLMDSLGAGFILEHLCSPPPGGWSSLLYWQHSKTWSGIPAVVWWDWQCLCSDRVPGLIPSLAQWVKDPTACGIGCNSGSDLILGLGAP